MPGSKDCLSIGALCSILAKIKNADFPIPKPKEDTLMPMKKYRFFIMMTTVLISLIAACSSSKLDVKPIAKSDNPTDHINRLENDLADARKNQLHVLSPTWFAKAASSLDTAKTELDKGKELSEILNNIAMGRAQLQKAEETARISRTTLPSVIKGRDLARAAGAVKLGKDYTDAEEEFLELTQAIEKNDLKYAQKHKKAVAEAFRQLEMRAIKIETIGEVRRLIKLAKDQGVDKIAPESFAFAQKKLTEADAFITANPYKKETMLQKAGEALFMARRLFQIAGQSEKFKTMEPEQITLWMEKMLHDITNKLYATDMRDQPFKIQVENILGSVLALQDDRQFMFDQVKALQSEIESKNTQIADKENLAAEKRFNELFVKVQNIFYPDEAEVYKKGNLLIIRLRGIQFPVGQSVIMPDNYPLLTKVQQAIRTFNEPDVIIEGHTDSTGSDEINEHLSQQRSESVRQYLVANKTLTYDRIVAVGYGSSKPLASNKTEEGRAINRRIDVIIRPLFQSDAN